MKSQHDSPKTKPRRWFKRLLIFIVLFFPIKMAFEVSRVPNYDGGKAYIDYSPDGKYRSAMVYTDPKNQTAWTDFARGISGHSHYLTYLISDPSGKTIYAMVPVDYYWVSSGRSTIWHCGDKDNKLCHGYLRSYGIEGTLPPSLWQRAHAWLTVRIKGFQGAEFGEVVIMDQ